MASEASPGQEGAWQPRPGQASPQPTDRPPLASKVTADNLLQRRFSTFNVSKSVALSTFRVFFQSSPPKNVLLTYFINTHLYSISWVPTTVPRAMWPFMPLFLTASPPHGCCYYCHLTGEETGAPGTQACPRM